MATHSSTLAWKIPWTEEPGRLQSMGSWRVGHDGTTSLSLFTFMHWRRKWQPTPVFLPGESQGRGTGLLSMGSHRVGHDWSDLAAAAEAKESIFQSTIHSGKLCWVSTKISGTRLANRHLSEFNECICKLKEVFPVLLSRYQLTHWELWNRKRPIDKEEENKNRMCKCCGKIHRQRI